MRFARILESDASRVLTVLVVTGTICVLCVGLLGTWVASRYAALTFEADTQQRTTVVHEVVDDLLWRRHFEQAGAATVEIASEVRPLLGDQAKLSEALNTVEKRGAFSLQTVTPLGVDILAPGGERLAGRWL